MTLFQLHQEVLGDLTRLSLTKEGVTSRSAIICEFQRSLPRVQLVPAPLVPDASSLSLSLFLSGPAGSEFAPKKSKNSWAVQD